MNTRPHYDLVLGSMSHANQTAEMMMKNKEVINNELLDKVFVYGDINSTLAATNVAKKLHILIFHIELGLRSYIKKPEEIDRVMTDHVSKLLFVSNNLAVSNLEKIYYRKGSSSRRFDIWLCLIQHVNCRK